jgi:hypothetical protein
MTSFNSTYLTSSILSQDQIMELQRKSRCSVLIKALPDFSDFYVGHTTWSDYYLMLRIEKSYYLRYSTPSVKSKRVQFSSYPGMVHSYDDFYLLDSKVI